MVGFHDIILAYFTQVTGRLVMFSGRDIALMQQWRAQGASAANICCGIRDAVLSMEEGADPPRSLYNCKAYIEPYVLRSTERLVSGDADAETVVLAVMPAPAPDQDRERELERERYAVHVRRLMNHAIKAVERAGHRVKEESLRRLYREVWHKLKAMQRVDISQQPQILAELELLDEALAERWYGALSDAERAEIDAQICDEGQSIARRASPEAWQRWTAMRRRHVMGQRGLISLIDVTLL
jgi:hypothetical protein